MIITVEEARTLLGEVATRLSDKEVARLITFLEKLCNKIIDEVIK